MTSRLHSFIRTDREGQTLAVVAVMMVGLLAVMALAIDLGMAYTARAEAQRVADSAALAGASAFLDYTIPLDAVTDAEDRARDYAGRNFVRNRPVDPVGDLEVVVLPDQERVRVWVSRTGLPAWFSRFLGRTEINVRAMAAAEARKAGAARCVKPLAIPDRWEELSTSPVEDFDGDQVMDFDNNIPCNGVACNANEVWTFEDGVDDYRPLNPIGSLPAYDPTQATSWGSMWLDGENRDAGARILLTPQQAKGTGTPGWYQYWKMPGSSGAADLKAALAGCIEPGTLGLGDLVEADPQSGNIGNPVYKAFEQLWDPNQDGDADIEWDPVNNTPHYPNDPTRSIWDSPRVFTVLLVHPGDIRQGSSQTMRVVDFATVFLEVPTDHYGDQGGNSFKLPIWGRLFHFGPGAEGPVAGSLQKYLRLVE